MIETDILSNLDGSQKLTADRIVRGASKVWANISGTAAPAALRSSHNVSSLVDQGVGVYGVNFTAPFASKNFVALFNKTNNASQTSTAAYDLYTQRTASFAQATAVESGGVYDTDNGNLTINGDLAP